MVNLRQLSAAFQAPQDNKSTVLLALAGSAGAIAALGLLATRSSNSYKRKPSSFEISGGAVDAKKVKDTVRAQRSGRGQLGSMPMQRRSERGPLLPAAVRLAAVAVLLRLPAGLLKCSLARCMPAVCRGSACHDEAGLSPAGQGVLWRVQHPGARQGRGDEGVAKGLCGVGGRSEHL